MSAMDVPADVPAERAAETLTTECALSLSEALRQAQGA